jgi:hypothetical protein
MRKIAGGGHKKRGVAQMGYGVLEMCKELVTRDYQRWNVCVHLSPESPD